MNNIIYCHYLYSPPNCFCSSKEKLPEESIYQAGHIETLTHNWWRWSLKILWEIMTDNICFARVKVGQFRKWALSFRMYPSGNFHCKHLTGNNMIINHMTNDSFFETLNSRFFFCFDKHLYTLWENFFSMKWTASLRLGFMINIKGLHSSYIIVLCCWVRHLTLSVTLSIQEYNWLPINPFYPNISRHILHTVHDTFLVVLTRGICLIIKSFFCWWSFPLFSWH